MSNQEKVARAVLRHPYCESEEGLNRWHCTGCGEVVATGSKYRARAAFHKHQAAAAIDALADVEALTSVIDLHVFDRQPDGSLMCVYDDEITTEDYVGAHIAAAVVAWMKDAL